MSVFTMGCVQVFISNLVNLFLGFGVLQIGKFVGRKRKVIGCMCGRGFLEH